MPKCNKCNITKHRSTFVKDNRKKSGIAKVCSEYRNTQNRRYYLGG